MKQHYILNINPEASSDWDRCVLRNPITGERPDLITEIAEAVENQEGSYLIKVTLQVEILEQSQTKTHQDKTVEISTGNKSGISSAPRLVS